MSRYVFCIGIDNLKAFYSQYSSRTFPCNGIYLASLLLNLNASSSHDRIGTETQAQSYLSEIFVVLLR